MANMSYCRFQNTVTDLKDCAEHLFDANMSEDEMRARRWLIDTCARILRDLDWDVETPPKEEMYRETEMFDGEEEDPWRDDDEQPEDVDDEEDEDLYRDGSEDHEDFAGTDDESIGLHDPEEEPQAGTWVVIRDRPDPDYGSIHSFFTGSGWDTNEKSSYIKFYTTEEQAMTAVERSVTTFGEEYAVNLDEPMGRLNPERWENLLKALTNTEGMEDFSVEAVNEILYTNWPVRDLTRLWFHYGDLGKVAAWVADVYMNGPQDDTDPRSK